MAYKDPEYMKKYYLKKREHIKEYQKRNKEKIAGYNKEYCKRNKEYIKEYNKKWKEKNKEYIKERRLKYKEKQRLYKREWRKNNREKWISQLNKYRNKNPEKIKKRIKIWREKNKEKINRYNEEWRKKNPEKVKLSKKNNYITNIKNNKEKRLNLLLSSSIKKSLKGKKGGKHWEDLVGYSLFDLKNHLEAQFKYGMSWDNYGYYGWHIDHIKPKIYFKFEDYNDPQFKECWSLNNLQPLWAEENNKKRDWMEIDGQMIKARTLK